MHARLVRTRKEDEFRHGVESTEIRMQTQLLNNSVFTGEGALKRQADWKHKFKFIMSRVQSESYVIFCTSMSHIPNHFTYLSSVSFLFLLFCLANVVCRGWQGLIAQGCHSSILIIDPKTAQTIQVLERHKANVVKVSLRSKLA